MTKQVGEQESRYQQGETPDLRSQYRAIGIPAISAAAALCKDKKQKSASKQQTQAQTHFLDFQD
jgi:hypothetical protein